MSVAVPVHVLRCCPCRLWHSFSQKLSEIRTREHFLCFNVWTVESAEYCVFGKCPLLSPCSLPAFAPFKKLLCSEQLSYFYKYYSFHNLLISRADTICSQLATAQFPNFTTTEALSRLATLHWSVRIRSLVVARQDLLQELGHNGLEIFPKSFYLLKNYTLADLVD